jgi:hypothetical protein
MLHPLGLDERTVPAVEASYEAQHLADVGKPVIAR